ncbi:hypothetical protein C8F01DRAFT_1176366 [Mycena amicta]|nr:hypothetical protein C8F01DRAFT_1176366 [Mycena amicta]
MAVDVDDGLVRGLWIAYGVLLVLRVLYTVCNRLGGRTPTRSGWRKRLLPSRGSSPNPSDSASAGAAADTAVTWLDGLLLVARAGLVASEAAPPGAKAVFGSVVLILEKVEKVKKNQEALKALCEKIVSTLKTLQSVIRMHPEIPDTDPILKECQDFQRLLDGISAKIEEIKKAQTSRRQQVKEFLMPASTAV